MIGVGFEDGFSFTGDGSTVWQPNAGGSYSGHGGSGNGNGDGYIGGNSGDGIGYGRSGIATPFFFCWPTWLMVSP